VLLQRQLLQQVLLRRQLLQRVLPQQVLLQRQLLQQVLLRRQLLQRVLLGLLSDRWLFHHGCSGQEQRDTVTWLCAHAHPMTNAVFLQNHSLITVFGQHRIIMAKAFKIAAIPWFTGISNNNAVEGALFGPAAGQTNF
jgi:hypothetical protein